MFCFRNFTNCIEKLTTSLFKVDDVFMIMLLLYLEVRSYMTKYFGFTLAKRFEMVFLEFRSNLLLISTRSCLPNIEDIGRHIHDINRRKVFRHRKRIYAIHGEIDIFHKPQLDQNLVADIKAILGLKCFYPKQLDIHQQFCFASETVTDFFDAYTWRN